MIIYICNCLPIQKNKVLLFSYYGSQYGCNPKYISEYMNTHYPTGKFDIVWAFNNLINDRQLDDVRIVKTLSLRYFYELCTAKVIVTNYRMTDLFVKRKHQYYIQTWHSSLRLKQIEQDAQEVLPEHYIQMAKKDSAQCDLLLSGCQYSTDIFQRAFWYTGEIFKAGTPRNDLLFQKGHSKRSAIMGKLSLDMDQKVLLYAPTFRTNDQQDIEPINYEALSKTLTNSFGGEWIILVKLHPHLLAKEDQVVRSKHVRNVSTYDDIQELMFIADMLISDYSSLMFDFSITKRPCFLYVPDLEIYTSAERKLYFNLLDLPFIHATSNESLRKKLTQFDQQQYAEGLETFLAQVGSYEDGRASELLAQRINDVCFKKGEVTAYEAV